MKKICFLFSAVVFMALAAGSQATVILSPEKDNTLYQNFPGNSNGSGVDFFAGNNNGNTHRRALIKFDIAAGIPAGATITSVTLTLVCNRTRAGADNVSLHTLNADWGEGSSDGGPNNDGDGAPASTNDATWPCSFSDGAGGCITSWTTDGGDFNAVVSATSSVGGAVAPYSWTSVQMKDDVQAWLNSPSTNFGWIIIGDESTNQTAKRFASKDNATETDRPQLSVTYIGGLPVTLLFFRASEIRTGVLLNWETAQEFNNAFFSVEHSTDGIHFSPVGKVNGNGTSFEKHSYQFKHEGIQEGRHYYRLAQTDMDRRINYSNIVLITSKSNYFSLQINPNPVNDKIVLQGSANWSGSNYTIISQTGIVVSSGPVYGNSINVHFLAKGAYYIRLLRAVDGVILSGQFLKQ